MISVIITTYQRKTEIVERAIKSVLAQTYSNWELIVVDDSPSTYACRANIGKMVESYSRSSPVSYIQHDKNYGACKARNTGLYQAKGEYIAFLDDDDEWVNTKLEKQINKFEQCDSKVALIYCDGFYVNEKSGKNIIQSRRKLSGDVYDSLIEGNFIGGFSYPVIRRSALLSVNGLDEQMQASQDWDLWLRLAQGYQVDYVDEPLVRYNAHFAGEQISTDPKKKLSGALRIYEKNIEYIEKNNETEWLLKSRLAPLYAWNGEIANAFNMWLKAVMIKPAYIKKNLSYLMRIMKRYFMFTFQIKGM